jgi:predicted negative regulator of RcsB-dependent stress response
MKTLARVLTIGTALIILACGLAWAASEEKTQKAEKPPLIQIAILLDTSNSMDGLIAQAKTELWRIVNEFATARREGKRPELRVALYEYGNNSLAPSEGYIRRVLPLTDDLDKVSEELFALKTNGGQEYCGQVIQVSVQDLAWSKDAGDYKAIFIAGNEPFTQGSVDFRTACTAAIEKGIIVNTIFCGAEAEGVNTHWKDGALLAEGAFLSINQATRTVAITAPQDAEIARLGAQLSGTYLPYGEEGGRGLERQAAQEVNAARASAEANVQRQVSKATRFYNNSTWDLVDATREGRVKLDEVKPEALPAPMRTMDGKERKAYVETQSKKRADIQAQINTLNEARKKYVAEQMRKPGATAEKTFDKAVIDTVRTQAGKKSFKFE